MDKVMEIVIVTAAGAIGAVLLFYFLGAIMAILWNGWRSRRD